MGFNQFEYLFNRLFNLGERVSFPLDEALADYTARVKAEAEDKTFEPGISTGFFWLDNHIGGGMRDEKLVTVGGRPGMGKSAMLLSMALRSG